VLCVNSDSGTRTVFQDALPGYQLVFASGAYEALRSFNSPAFDLYVLEYWLPDWSGVSLCRHIRKVDPHVPVCFCTSTARPEDRQRAERAGANIYVVKPADPQLLNAEMCALMESRARRNEAACAAALAAIRQQFERRFAGLPDGTSCDQVENALKRSVRSQATDAFLAAGGTLAGFERVWELLCSDAWRAAAQL